MNQQSVPYRKSLGVLVGAIACLLVAQLFPGTATAADKYEQLILADRPVAYWRCQQPAEQDAERVTARKLAATRDMHGHQVEHFNRGGPRPPQRQ